jgi:hypothetical protein
MVEVQGEGGEETQDFAKAQRPNLDPEVGEYGKALADKAERVRELLGEHLEQGVDLEVGSLSSLLFSSPPFFCALLRHVLVREHQNTQENINIHTRAHTHTHTSTHAHTRTNTHTNAHKRTTYGPDATLPTLFPNKTGLTTPSA